jgi:hypothetical protein
MNITKIIREELLCKVLKDQYQERFNLWVNQTALVVAAEKLKKDGGLSKVLLATAKSFPKSDVSLRTESEVTVSSYNRFNTLKVTNDYAKNINNVIFKFVYSFESKEQFVIISDCSIERNLIINNEMEKGEELFNEINLCKRNLTAVLNAVRTSKQLEEMTSVFKPFMPLPKPKTNLIPLDAVFALNLLKSPSLKNN